MGRRKINIAYISNQATRKATLRKRMPSLLKKTSELATLCDVDAAIVVYSQDEQDPRFWPAQPPVVQRILEKFLDLPEIEQSRKMFTHETYLKDCIEKLEIKIKKEERKLELLDISNLMNGENAHELAFYIKEKIQEVQSKIVAEYPNTNEEVQDRDQALFVETTKNNKSANIDHIRDYMREIDLPNLHFGSSSSLAETHNNVFSDTITPTNNNGGGGEGGGGDQEVTGLGDAFEFSEENDTGYLSDIFKRRRIN